MEIKVNILFEDKLQYLTDKFQGFNFLFDSQKISSSNCFKWNRIRCTKSYDVIQVIFTGKTGYGKSSTLNAILDTNKFKADDVKNCTKDLYSAEFKCHTHRQYSLSFGDLPGIGESKKADEKYLTWYQNFVTLSHCNVYFLKADQRDYAVDHKECFDGIFSSENVRNKTIIALNCVDKIEPLHRNIPFCLSDKQKYNLNVKIKDISQVFNISEKQIVPIAATEKYNLHSLMNAISLTLKKEIKYSN